MAEPDEAPERSDFNYRESGRLGGLTGWANTANRSARMEHVRRNSPAHTDWHARRLGLDPNSLFKEELARCETDRRRYYAELRAASARALKRQRAERLRAKAARLDAEAAARDPHDGSETVNG